METVAVNWAQVFFNSLVTASIYFLISLGLSMTWGLLRFPNVAHAEFLTFGGLVAYTLLEGLKLNLISGVLAAFIITGALGVFSYFIIFKPLSNRGATVAHLIIASIAYGLVLRYLMYQAWGPRTLIFSVWFEPLSIGPVRATTLWVSTIIIALALLIALHLFLTRTKLGKAMRALSNNPVLGMACGIEFDKVMLLVWFMGAGLAGLGGVLRAFDTRLTPYFGWELIIPMFAVVIFGGIGSVYGVVAASLTLGVAENVAIVSLVAMGLSTEYRIVVAYVIVVVLLLFKPRGLAGIDLSKVLKLLKKEFGG